MTYIAARFLAVIKFFSVDAFKVICGHEGLKRSYTISPRQKMGIYDMDIRCLVVGTIVCFEAVRCFLVDNRFNF